MVIVEQSVRYTWLGSDAAVGENERLHAMPTQFPPGRWHSPDVAYSSGGGWNGTDSETSLELAGGPSAAAQLSCRLPNCGGGDWRSA